MYPVFSSRVEFLLGICHILNLYNDYNCSRGVHFTAEYMFFSGSGLLLLNILLDYDHFPKGYKNMRKAYFPALATSPSLEKKSVHTCIRCVCVFLPSWGIISWNGRLSSRVLQLSVPCSAWKCWKSYFNFHRIIGLIVSKRKDPLRGLPILQVAQAFRIGDIVHLQQLQQLQQTEPVFSATAA